MMPTNFKPSKTESRALHTITPIDLRRMNVPEDYWGVSLDKCDPELRSALLNYWKHSDTLEKRGSGLSLNGGNGVGKTSAAVMLLKKARAEYRTCFFIRVGELRVALKANASFDADMSMAERIREVDVLVLDDFGSAHIQGYPFNLDDMVDLVSSRGSRHRVTHLTTGVWSELSAVSGNLSEKLGSYLIPVSVVGTNRRLAQLKQASALVQPRSKT
jgi:DNA replication protein DnaC